MKLRGTENPFLFYVSDIMNSASGRTAISMAAMAADAGPFLKEYTAYAAEYISAAASPITHAALI